MFEHSNVCFEGLVLVSENERGRESETKGKLLPYTTAIAFGRITFISL